MPMGGCGLAGRCRRAALRRSSVAAAGRVKDSAGYQQLCAALKDELSKRGLSYLEDDGGASIGRRYARNDELGGWWTKRRFPGASSPKKEVCPLKKPPLISQCPGHGQAPRSA